MLVRDLEIYSTTMGPENTLEDVRKQLVKYNRSADTWFVLFENTNKMNSMNKLCELIELERFICCQIWFYESLPEFRDFRDISED